MVNSAVTQAVASVSQHLQQARNQQLAFQKWATDEFSSLKARCESDADADDLVVVKQQQQQQQPLTAKGGKSNKGKSSRATPYGTTG